MSNSNRGTKKTGAEDISWNLTDLYKSESELDQDMAKSEAGAKVFSDEYRGRVGALDAKSLARALHNFEDLQDTLDRIYTYAFLDWCTDTGDSKRGALLQRAREHYSQIGQQILFFEIELIQLPSEDLLNLAENPNLSNFKHFIETLDLRKEHVLSEPEERIVAEKAVTGISAWSRYFDETLGAARFNMNGEELTEQEVLSRLYGPDRETRRSAALAFSNGLQENLRSLTYVFNTVLAEKASEDRLRNYENWLTSRNISNEISDEAVDALVNSVTARYDLVSRYYGLKKQLIGLDEMFDYDRYAPIDHVETKYTWGEAKDLVMAAYGSFHPRVEEIVSLFFEKRWIDAAVRPGKRGGAFSHRAVPQVHPYILLNFNGNARDVQTLAHELGHGVHQYLARVKGSIGASTPLTTSETASVFGEMLVFEALMQRESDPRIRQSMVMNKIDDTIATVFRQITMNLFEGRMHEARRTEGELSPERLSQFWRESQESMFQGSVTLGEHYDLWWSYIPHFIHTPGYVYAYAFGELLVLALYALYQKEPVGFAEKYLQLLEAGGSDWPHVLVGQMGVDLQDPGFWTQGLHEIEKLIELAEELAGQPQPA